MPSVVYPTEEELLQETKGGVDPTKKEVGMTTSTEEPPTKPNAEGSPNPKRTGNFFQRQEGEDAEHDSDRMEDEDSEDGDDDAALIVEEDPAPTTSSIPTSTTINNIADQEAKFRYLLAQSDVFAKFMAGSVDAKKEPKKASKGGKGKAGRFQKGGRLTEAEEDRQLAKAQQSQFTQTGIEKITKQPSCLGETCKMHPYQIEGLNWLVERHNLGINGILADEMGLGKTLQTISLLAYLRERRRIMGPHLVVVPKSVVGNWVREFHKWCPDVRVVKMPGKSEERRQVMKDYVTPVVNALQQEGKDKGGKKDMDDTSDAIKYPFDVLVVSFEGMLKEQGGLSKIPWEYLVIDEAHRIKNENSSLSRAVRTLHTKHRVLVTGTPLQNNLHELWALLNFLLPEIFGDSHQFDEWFNVSSSSSQDNVIRKLHVVLKPFMLRRVKKDVACALPPKKETKLFVGLTNLQREWYARLLRKDAVELNKLGGPSRVTLLNTLMHLRKVCNHPYLFDGAEPGPPYSDGPHLWEASGKTMLLHKLLPKLKAQQSRVLIFSQMTRVLDILEDYLRYQNLEYCRIDGNTDGERRDAQMDEFNAPQSTKFCFLLSTRAGGLGINLATADIVILYDSDYNPQVDLQAMDRAHRLGQTKPVQVFRFVAENTVEEKIIERADRKLFLDAAVIQQGRLAEKHKSADRDELMQMVRFGADQILSSKGGTYTDEDIDALIAKGERKTTDTQARLQTNAQHNLASFSIDASSSSLYNTPADKKDEGSGGDLLMVQLEKRERKKNYDVNEYYREAMKADATGDGHDPSDPHLHDGPPRKKRQKGANAGLQDFQLYDVVRIRELERMEKAALPAVANATAATGNNLQSVISMATATPKPLATTPDPNKTLKEITAEKDKLLAEGYPDWSRREYKCFCSALERYGRFDVASIVEDVVRETQGSKSPEEVKRYFVSFWTNYRRIHDWKKIIDKIERAEKKRSRLQQVRTLVEEAVHRHLYRVYGPQWRTMDPPEELVQRSWPHLRVYFKGVPMSAFLTKVSGYSEEEDAFLLCQMYRHNYPYEGTLGMERIRREILKAWQFKFDWLFRGKGVTDLQKRCEGLLKVLEKQQAAYWHHQQQQQQMQQQQIQQQIQQQQIQQQQQQQQQQQMPHLEQNQYAQQQMQQQMQHLEQNQYAQQQNHPPPPQQPRAVPLQRSGWPPQHPPPYHVSMMHAHAHARPFPPAQVARSLSGHVGPR